MLTTCGPALAAALEPAAARARPDPTTSTLLATAACQYVRHDDESMVRAANDAAELIAGTPEDDWRAADAMDSR